MIQQISAYSAQNSQLTTPSVSSTPKNSFASVFQNANQSPSNLDAIFAKASKVHNVPEDLLKAIGYHESRYQPEVVSSAGAMGVMQLMPATAKTMGVSNPFDAEQNIMGGAKLLGQLIEKYDGDLKLTLASYGAGSGAVAKYNGVPPYAETQNFVKDIMSALGRSDVGNTNSQTQNPSDFRFDIVSGIVGSGSVASLPETTGSSTYDTIREQINNFKEYTMTDYQVFLQFLMKEAEEQKKLEVNGLPEFTPFYL